MPFFIVQRPTTALAWPTIELEIFLSHADACAAAAQRSLPAGWFIIAAKHAGQAIARAVQQPLTPVAVPAPALQPAPVQADQPRTRRVWAKPIQQPAW